MKKNWSLYDNMNDKQREHDLEFKIRKLAEFDFCKFYKI